MTRALGFHAFGELRPRPRRSAPPLSLSLSLSPWAPVHSGLYQKCSYTNLAGFFDPQEHAERTKRRQAGQYVLEIAGGASFVLLLRAQKGARDEEELGAYVRDAPRITRGLLARRPAAAILYFVDGRVAAVEVAAPQDKVPRTPAPLLSRPLTPLRL
jgi:hypothetical protein